MTSTGPSFAGTLLDRRYRVDGLLARGGMSAVYRGVDTRLDRPVAIKIMDSRFADDRTFVDRFENEARSAARLHHPNVVAVHDQGFDTSAGPESKRAFLVMELVDGGTLRDLLDQRGALDVPLALTVFESVLSALAAAHAAAWSTATSSRRTCSSAAAATRAGWRRSVTSAWSARSRARRPRAPTSSSARWRTCLPSR